MADRDEFMDLNEDAAWIAAAFIFVAMLTGAIVLAEWPLWGVAVQDIDEPRLVQPTDDGNGTRLWPYTARAPSYDSRTLGINIVFFGDPTSIQTALTSRSNFTWETEQLHEGDADSETVTIDRLQVDPQTDNLSDVISWGQAKGSTRYTYIESSGQGRWLTEAYQLHAGTYFGSRMHIRAYEDPQSEWTAVQVHEEHWDWFRLRHTVTGISDAQREIEQDFMGERYVAQVVRIPFENETADSDGWVSGIYLAGLFVPLLVSLLGRPTRRVTQEAAQFLRRRRHAIAAGLTLGGLYLGIRAGGIAAESLFGNMAHTAIAGGLYLTLVTGLPAAAYIIGRYSNPAWVFAFTALGLGAAITIDFTAMGVAVVPLRVILHRGSVLLAIGLIALGAARSDTNGHPTGSPPLMVGLVGWLLTLFAPFFGYI